MATRSTKPTKPAKAAEPAKPAAAKKTARPRTSGSGYTPPPPHALAPVLKKAKARWTAGETEVGKLSHEARMAMLGADESHEERTLMAAAGAMSSLLAAAPTFDPAVDWRNIKGANHITPVRNQGGCGSCVSHGCLGVIEAMAHIESNRWLDLSEADAHFCSSHGANCEGWNAGDCMNQIVSRGVCEEAAFPYASAFSGSDIWHGTASCKVINNREQRVVRATTRVALTTATEAKNHLTHVGPVTGSMTVYEDFFNYRSGVYHHVSGRALGGHCILVVGYSEAEQCWIIKNSWDTTWGAGGFAKVAYADLMRNGAFAPMYGATGITMPATGWQPLGGVLTSRPMAGNNADGRIEVFVRGGDNALWHVWQTAPNGPWSGWASLGGGLSSTPSVVSNADGRLEIFARGADNGLWHIWQTAPNGGWSGWASLGGIITSDPVAGKNADGRIEVFARGSDGVLCHIWQRGAQQGWSGWASLGLGMNGNPAVGNNKDGRLEVFARGSDGALLHVWQTAPNGTWSSWSSMGGTITSDPAVGRNADGRLEVFVRGIDNGLWHRWQTAPNNGWSGYATLGGIITSNPVVASNADGRLEVFVRGKDNTQCHIWQTAPNSGWSSWGGMGGVVTSDCALTRHKDGRLELLHRGSDNALWHRWQVEANSYWN